MGGLRVRGFAAALVAFCAGLSPAAAGQATGHSAPLMSERAYAGLSRAQAALRAGDYAQAEQLLLAMQADARLSKYERAILLQTFGYLYTRQARYAEAIDFFERCAALDALPDEAQYGMLHSLVSLYANQGRWQDAVTTIDRWLAAQPEPPATAYVTIAGAYAEVLRYRDAVGWIDKAIAEPGEPQRAHYELAFAYSYELGDFAACVRTARAMLDLWPGEGNYWAMLQGAYQALGDDTGALAAMQLGYDHGTLVAAQSIVNLARLQMFLGVPFDAGELLERELARGRVAPTPEHLALVLSAWEAAREFDRALAALDALAAVEDDAGLYVRKAQLLAERHRWGEVVAAADRALAHPDLTRSQRANALLQKGVAQVELAEPDGARAAFEAANGLGGTTAEQARAWLNYLREGG